MFFDSFSDFIQMDGHGVFVWVSYGIASAIVAHNFLSPMINRKKVIKDIERQQRREQK